MAINPKSSDPLTGTNRPSRYDPRGSPWRWAAYVGVLIVVLLALFWLFDEATDTATTPAPATTEGSTTAPAAPAGGATAPAAPAAPQ